MQRHVERIVGLRRACCTGAGDPAHAGPSPAGTSGTSDPAVDAAFADLIGDDAAALRMPVARGRRRCCRLLTLSSVHPLLPDPSPRRRPRSSPSCSTAPEGSPLMLYRLVRTYLTPYAGDARGAPRPPARRDARLALPAQPERPDHRRGRRRRRHRVHHRTGVRHARRSRSCRSSPRSAPTRIGAQTSASLGRDVRSSVFHRVGQFSAQELSRFGAPTLISRSTNDVTQVQTVTYMFLAIMVSAPIMMVGGIFMALREDLGLAWLVAVAVPALGDRRRPDHLADGAALPLDAGRRRLGQPHPARADHRHAGRARLRPRGRRARALRRGQPHLHRHRARRRQADGAGLPGRHDHLQRLDGRGAVVRRAPDRERRRWRSAR